MPGIGRTQTDADIAIRDAVKAGGPMPFLADRRQSSGEEMQRITQRLNAGEQEALMATLRRMVRGRRRRATSSLSDLVAAFQLA